jgi:hypothetical protein
MPTTKELGLEIGERVFFFGARKHTSLLEIGGLSLEDAKADPSVKVEFALLELIKQGNLSDLFKIIYATDYKFPGIDERDFPNIPKAKDTTTVHNLYPNYIIDGIGPEPHVILSQGVIKTDELFENRSDLLTPEGIVVGELRVNNQGISWVINR